MTVLWGVLVVVVAVVWLVTVSDLVRRHLETKRTVAWLLIVLIFPLLGAGLYWVLRGPETEAAGPGRGG